MLLRGSRKGAEHPRRQTDPQAPPIVLMEPTNGNLAAALALGSSEPP
jgi:hypothetical protein